MFDTWFTSSLTPQIGSGWILDPERHARLAPMDIRPQAHDIIRTWAFYTIAKAHLHFDTIPWRHALISGWILDPDRKKMSKSRGNTVTPQQIIDTHHADAGALLGCQRPAGGGYRLRRVGVQDRPPAGHQAVQRPASS